MGPEVERRQPGEREVDQRAPGASGCGHVEARQDQQLACAGGGDVPQACPLSVELGLLGLERCGVAGGLDSEYRQVEPVAFPVEDRLVRRPEAGHSVDRHHDGPLQSLRGVHGVERCGLFLCIGASFDGAGFVGPRAGHRLGAGAKPAHRVGAAEAQIQVDVGQRAFGLSAVAGEEDGPHAQLVDRLREQRVGRGGVDAALQGAELRHDVAGQRMGDGPGVDPEVEPWQGGGRILRAG